MWMNQPSRHQEDLAAEMRRLGVSVTVIYASPLRKERKEIGWEVHASARRTRFLSSRYAFLEVMKLVRQHPSSIHIVNGIWAESAFFVAIAVCFLQRIPCCIYSEAPTSMVRAGWSRRFRRPIQAMLTRLFARRMWLLAISWISERAFSRLGFSRARIYRFGYFENPSDRPTEPSALSVFPEILYLGRLVRGKGIELLIEAAAPLLRENPRLHLRIVGGGVMEEEFRRTVQAFGLESQILFSGVVTSPSVPALMTAATMLVLPSEEDGWGIVVNQALQAGTPVVVSDSCGAAELVANGVNGYIFRTGDRDQLSGCLSSVLENPYPQRMRAAAEEAGRAVSAKEAAPYLLDCLEHMLGLRSEKPLPKWILNPRPRPADI